MACGYSWGFSSCDFLHAHPFQLPGIILNVTSTKCTSCVLLSWCNVAPQRENERAFVKQEEQLTTVSISYLWRRMSGNNKELSKSNREIKSLENNKTKKATSVQTNFNIRGSTCCDPCWHCTQSHSTMPLVSELGRGPKPQYISAMEHLFPFRGGGCICRAPTCSHIFLSCHIAWQFILGSAGWHLRHKADKALVVTSMRPVGAMRMPLAVQCYKMDNTAPHILAKCEERHQLFAQFHLHRGGKKKQHAISKCETAAGAGSNSDYWTCLKSEPLWWTLLQIGVFPWLLPNACWE